MQTIETRRHQDYERFEANRRFEEMTDIAERLGYPIDVTIHYELRGDTVYAATDTVERPFHNQTFQAMKAGEHQYAGDQAFQRERLRLEHEEALMVDRFASGQLDGNVLIKYSKVPDAVVEGRTSINGYRRDLLRSFVRMYYRTDSGVSCRLFTLDHNLRHAVEKVGKLLDIDTTRPSEEVLADHTLLTVPTDPEYFVSQLVDRTIETYDRAAAAETGSYTHAGSHYLDKRDAMSAITKQPHLISQHMDAVTAIMQQGLGEAVLEQERKRTAAAIKLASEGFEVTSTADTAVTSEAETGQYSRDCATANGMNQAAKSMENKWSLGECQVCFVRTKVGSCAVCASCAAADDRGVDLLKLRDQNLRRRHVKQSMAVESIKQTNTSPKKLSKRELVKRQYGEYAELRHVTTIGGAKKQVVHRRSEEVLAEF